LRSRSFVALSEAALDETHWSGRTLWRADRIPRPPGDPYLAALAKKGGMIGDMALERILQLDAKTALTIARPLLGSEQVPDKLYAMRSSARRAIGRIWPRFRR